MHHIMTTDRRCDCTYFVLPLVCHHRPYSAQSLVILFSGYLAYLITKMRPSPFTAYAILFYTSRSHIHFDGVRSVLFAPPMPCSVKQNLYGRQKPRAFRTVGTSPLSLSMNQDNEGINSFRVEELPLNQIFQKALILQRSGDRSGSLEEYKRFLKVAESHDVDPILYVSFLEVDLYAHRYVHTQHRTSISFPNISCIRITAPKFHIADKLTILSLSLGGGTR